MARKKKNQYPVNDGAGGGFVLILLVVIAGVIQIVLPYILAIGAIALAYYLGYVLLESFGTNNSANDSNSSAENKTDNKLSEYKNLPPYTSYTIDRYKKY